MAMRISPTEIRPLPPLRGLRRNNGILLFDPNEYAVFIQRISGYKINSNPTVDESARIASHLESFIDQRQRSQAWGPGLLEQYPTINSLVEIYALVRIFRTHQDQGT